MPFGEKVQRDLVEEMERAGYDTRAVTIFDARDAAWEMLGHA